jgi:hypothetical protein
MSIAKQVARALAEADKLIAKYGDDMPDGSVIAFEKTFPARIMTAFPPGTVNTAPESRTYSYAAVRANGLWYTTGPRSTSGYEWEALLDWMDDDGESLSVANFQVLRKGTKIMAELAAQESSDTQVLNLSERH